MIKTLFGTATLALAIAASPASAQLLGGGGGGGLGGALGGSLGGGLGGGLGGLSGSTNGMLGSTLERGPLSTDSVTRSTHATRTSKTVDPRKGTVNASNTTSSASALESTNRIGDRSLAGSGSGSASLGGSVDAQLVGTDAVRSTAGEATGAVRSGADRAVGATRSIADRGRSAAGNSTARATGAVNAVGASANGMASGAASTMGNAANTTGSLALAGSGAASAGAFPVAPGMAIRDTAGRAIGTVQAVRAGANGALSDVLVRVGNRVATLPAANFSGSGDVLVSAMGKGDVKNAAQ